MTTPTANVLDAHRPCARVRDRSARSGVLVAMALAIVAIAALAFWDERRESAVALDEFADEQTNVATAAGAALSTLLSRAHGSGAEISTDDALSALRAVDRAGAILVLIKRAGHDGLVTTRGDTVHLAPIDVGLANGAPWVRLDRTEASSVGLPARLAIAGLRTIDAGDLGQWGIAVVATAQHDRDRQHRAQWRLLLSVALASGLVLAFGGVALRKQRRELELAGDLAVAEVERDRDGRLVRADKLATMGALATGIAHEVSTPLGVIMGRAEQLMPKVAGDERAKRALDVIVEQSERISQVIRGFLRLARGGAPSLERVVPETLAQKAIELVEHRFEKADVRLSLGAAPKLPLIACEPRLFEQVLVNLLLNACDACEPGGAVELRLRGDGERVAFAVLDDGVGITPEAAARATEPFFTTKAPGEGSGLGLAITNEIVKHHQGTLTLSARSSPAGGDRASSPPGSRGTRACVEIPRAD